eukprot:Skav220558  [mRNA]  locus=scaffold761:289161:293517:+ [translate_table: standard]
MFDLNHFHSVPTLHTDLNCFSSKPCYLLFVLGYLCFMAPWYDRYRPKPSVPAHWRQQVLDVPYYVPSCLSFTFLGLLVGFYSQELNGYAWCILVPWSFPQEFLLGEELETKLPCLLPWTWMTASRSSRKGDGSARAYAFWHSLWHFIFPASSGGVVLISVHVPGNVPSDRSPAAYMAFISACILVGLVWAMYNSFISRGPRNEKKETSKKGSANVSRDSSLAIFLDIDGVLRKSGTLCGQTEVRPREGKDSRQAERERVRE